MQDYLFVLVWKEKLLISLLKKKVIVQGVNDLVNYMIKDNEKDDNDFPYLTIYYRILLYFCIIILS